MSRSKTMTQVQLQNLYLEIQTEINEAAAREFGGKLTERATRHLQQVGGNWEERLEYLEARQNQSRSWKIVFQMYCAVVEIIKMKKLDEVTIIESEQAS